MQIVQFPAFEKVVKKLHANAKQDLDNAVKELIRAEGFNTPPLCGGVFLFKIHWQAV